MLNIINLNSFSLYCVGDSHAYWDNLINYFDSHQISDAAVFFCGDNGLGFKTLDEHLAYFEFLNEECKKRNITCVLFRGNHDDPSYYSEQKINLSNIKSIPDYTIIQVAGHNVLCIGGALSIDRSLRIYRNEKNIKRTYWEEEMPAYDEAALNEIISNGISIDTVCTHTCPSFCEPKRKKGVDFWLMYDKELEKDLLIERGTLDLIYTKLTTASMPIKSWFYGHYHYHYSAVINGIDFTLLDKFRDMDGGTYDMVKI